ncbi:GBS Bsp-like repeat-containing protein [Acetobacterium wieringae]|uniref:GBS Bsp-like repeat-containing protein n=1 Tax=Acetobacterium wieringae TaxID=52694 RepID=UPI0026F04B74|nr:GBS Bsp-like repeat-containing protein [Acetobacterium wieringae]
MKFYRGVFICFVLIIALGLVPVAVLAEDSNNSGTMVTTIDAQPFVETREMLPGDVAVDPGWPDEAYQNDGITSSSVFSPRLSAPTSDNDFYFSKNIFYLAGYGMPNCTAYAWGRAYEILGSKPNLSNGNANEFWDYNLRSGAYPHGSTPEVGAILCWDGSSCGHVAVVEKIEGNKVTVSESSWSGSYFYTTTFTAGTEDSVSVGGFQGYIYLGDFDPEPAQDTTPPTITNAQITDVTDDGFTITCQVSDADSGIASVLFPTWTDANGQDDLVWHRATIDGNTASYRVSYSQHNNELGTYSVHVYAYDGAGNTTATALSVSAQKSITCSYQTHVQDYGWQRWKMNGQTSGTSGESKRLEAIEIQVDNKGYDLGIEYRTHIQNIGWQDWKHDGEISGTSNQGLRLEAIQVRLTGADASRYDVYYRVHAENIGWLDWAKNGGNSGTEGFGYRLEAIEIMVVPAGSPAPGSTLRAFESNN